MARTLGKAMMLSVGTQQCVAILDGGKQFKLWRDGKCEPHAVMWFSLFKQAIASNLVLAVTHSEDLSQIVDVTLTNLHEVPPPAPESFFPVP